MFGHKGFVHLNELIEGYTAPQPTGIDQGMAQRCKNLADKCRRLGSCTARLPCSSRPELQARDGRAEEVLPLRR
ncbi:uncharacterized protein K444DRAFT_407194 [Hyaloscypha bicolor E]|uniref:Uncharacterized protein n=1 Tax=Hyaloscypha bicolor E TaxID=1095630 RepID=A0A2J6T9G7_9HELO|nr:uncharacterized protein K444DRAFT_407194 [Hyaloscypha bicolor E]PMD59651.1 hypothetical protein K444DRAFT_407194 [Hyaloscypha bicolor E]